MERLRINTVHVENKTIPKTAIAMIASKKLDSDIVLLNGCEKELERPSFILKLKTATKSIFLGRNPIPFLGHWKESLFRI